MTFVFDESRIRTAESEIRKKDEHLEITISPEMEEAATPGIIKGTLDYGGIKGPTWPN